MTEPIDLDALERDKHRISFVEAQKRTDGGIPHAVVPVETFERLIAELRAARRVVEAAQTNVTCWLDIDPDSIPYVQHELGRDCPGCALLAALADYEASRK